MSTADFLRELLSEEIPARMQSGARNDLARMFGDELEKAGLSSEAIDVFSTPRRLALISRGVPLETQAQSEEIKGPRTSAPPQAIDGFLRKTGLKREQLEERDGVLFAVVETAGQPTRDLIGPMVERIVRAFPWPKSMRWGEASVTTASLRWVRPLHGIVAMLGEDIVPVAIDGITSGATTLGHRFHHPGPITVGGAGDYEQKLRACHVILDQDERETLIREGAEKAAAHAGVSLVVDDGLVVENAGLTEWPVPLLGRFDADYLDVPREVIVLTMRANQRYFACTDKKGALAPAFICIANIDPRDGGEAIVEGNRRVLAARLADARHFWEEDSWHLEMTEDGQRMRTGRKNLEERLPMLNQIVFHEKLGTVADKVERVAKLARWLAEEGIVEGADPDQVERAARLAKADLITGMVGEFPELQGLIGGHLAREQGEPGAIADAIRDQYKPLGQGDEVPTAPVTVAVALADKLDSILGFFLISRAPSGSKDPFALRRAAIAVIALCIEQRIRLPLRVTLVNGVLGFVETALDWSDRSKAGSTGLVRQSKALQNVPDWPGKVKALADAMERFGDAQADLQAAKDLLVAVKFPSAEVMLGKVQEVLDFFADRLKVQQREAGVRHDLIDAVFALGGEDDLVRLLERVKALQAFVETEEGADLLTAYKRAANILKREKWEGESPSAPRREEVKPEEQALISALDEAEPRASAAIEKEDFTAAMAALASLRSPIDAFFDHVTVNVDDTGARTDRLNLLMRFRDSVDRVADFSKIEG